LALALAASGCSSTPDEPKADSGEPKKSTGLFETPDWAQNFAKKREARKAITPEDLVGADGLCASQTASAEPPPQPLSEPSGPNVVSANAVSPLDPVAPAVPGGLQGPTVPGGIALAMTECEVVARAGQANSVQIGAEPDGERTAVLTYTHGPWPGLYRFRAGRLISMERVDVPEEPKAKKRARPPQRKPAQVSVAPRR
jgi:hypothetical protein